MPRILMFATGFAPYAASENLVNSKLALAMLGRGWDVQIISAADEGFTYVAEWEEPWLPLRPRTCEVQHKLGNNIGKLLSRGWSSLRMGHPIAGVRWGDAALVTALRSHDAKRFDFVLSRSISDFGHIPAMAFHNKTGIRWFANWNDPPSYIFPEPYRYTSSSCRKFWWNRYFREVLSTSDCNTFPCQRLANHILNHFGINDHVKTTIIPHIGLVGYQANKKLKDSCFRLCHAGNLSSERNPRPFLEALKGLMNIMDPADSLAFEIIGVEEVYLSDMINKLGMTSVVSFLGKKSYLETLDRLARNDVLVIIEAPCEEGIFMPSKLVDYVQVGRPVLAVSPLNGTVSDLINTRGGGICVNCRSVEDILTGLKTFYNVWRKDDLDSYRSINLENLFNPDTILNLYQNLMVQ